MSEIQTISVVVAATSVVAFVVNSIMTSRREEKRSQQTLETRQAQFMMQLNESMNNVAFWKDFIDLMNMEWRDIDDFEKKWGTGGNSDAAAKRLSLWWRYNLVGDLMKRGLVEREWLFDTCGSFVIQQWNKWERIIQLNRSYFNFNQWCESFEYLAKERARTGEEKGSKIKVVDTLNIEDSHLGNVKP